MATLSSAEAGVYTAIECAKDAIFFRDVLSGLGYQQLEPTTLFIDNENAIALSKPSRAITERLGTLKNN